MASDDGKKSKAGLFGVLGVLGIALIKFKVYIFAALKGLSFLKFGLFFKSFASIFLSLGLYWALYGLPFALVIILLLFIHETGHYVWMKACGLNPQPMVFVPFLGAYVQSQRAKDQATNSWVALAGPLVGGVFSAGFYLFGLKSGNGFLVAAGSVGFFLNLLQLIPAKPFDGGHVISAVSKWFLIPGSLLAFALSYYFQSILLLVIAAISCFSLFKEFTRKPEDDSTGFTQDSETPATLAQKALISVAYIGLTSMLGYLYWLSNTDSISMMPAKHRVEAMKFHSSSKDEPEALQSDTETESAQDDKQ